MTTATENKIEWLHFCEFEENGRYFINEPFVRGGFKVATDSRIMLVMPSDEPDTVSEKKFPDFKMILDRATKAVVDKEWPAEFPDCVCGRVKSNWVSLPKECPECVGRGVRVCDLGHDHDCDTCDGRGRLGGYRWFHNDKLCHIQLGGQSFDRQYISRINALPKPLRYGVIGDMLVVDGDAGLKVVLMCLDKDRV